MTDRSTAQTGKEETSSRRAAKKARTRALLIEAAAEVIAERGFHAASLMEIAARAGLTTGAVYSNFRSKEDLFLAVIRDVPLPLELGNEASPLWQRLGRVAIQAAQAIDEPSTRRLFKLQLEFALLTLQDPRLMREAVDDLHADREQLARQLTGIRSAARPEYRPSPEHLASAIIATLQGLQQHRFLDREAVPAELAAWAVQALLHAAVE